jgi:curved DNA-binding protein CbpA
VNSKQQQTHYNLLGVYPGASAIEIRRAYRELSKKYHPDTTTLDPAMAVAKFQALNEAYATISHPERRLAYDLEIGYSRFFVVQTPPSFQPLRSRPDKYRSSAYLDPNERPLSGGEIFALFMMIATFVSCLLLAVSIGIARGEL